MYPLDGKYWHAAAFRCRRRAVRLLPLEHVDHDRVAYRTEGSLRRPLSSAIGRVWERADIDAWAKATGRL